MKLHCLSLSGPLSRHRASALDSAYGGLRLRHLYISEQPDPYVKTSFHADGKVTRFPPLPVFNKTFPSNMR